MQQAQQLAQNIVKLVQQTVTNYASNPTLSPDQLRSFLSEVVKVREYQVSLQLMEALSRGKDKYLSLTSAQLTHYLTTHFLSQRSLAKYAVQPGYNRQDFMDQQQFAATLASGLTYIPQVTQESLCTLFDARVNLESPLLPLEDYPSLITSFFDPQAHYYPASPQTVQTQPLSLINDVTEPESQVPVTNSALSTFASMLMEELKLRGTQYDLEGKGFLFKSQVENFFYTVLELETRSIEFIMSSYLGGNNPKVSFDQFRQIVCEVHFREVLSTLIRHQLNTTIPPVTYMSKEYFTRKVGENCYFMRQKPIPSLLQSMFDELLQTSKANRQDQISLQDFRTYIKESCCRGRVRGVRKTVIQIPTSIAEVDSSRYEEDHSENTSLRQKDSESAQKIGLFLKGAESSQQVSLKEIKNTVMESEKQLNVHPPTFKEELWEKIEGLLNGYSQEHQGYLTVQELKSFLMGEGLTEQHQALLKAASKKDLSLDFIVGYLIHTHGEQALRQFAAKQIKGKASMQGEDEIQSVFVSAYRHFVGSNNTSLAQYVHQLSEKNDKKLLYRAYLQQVGRNLALRATF